MLENMFTMFLFLGLALHLRNRNRSRRSITYTGELIGRCEIRNLNLQNMIFEIDGVCLENCRMDRKAFFKLCILESRGGLMKRQISRLGETLSRKFHIVLKMHSILLKKSEPIPENSTDECWRWFKNCLGALDGTYIRVHVDASDKPRYRTRKGEIATNVLGVCTPDMQFIYVLPRWEGSAVDGRVLRDAISRRNDLKVPQGTSSIEFACTC
ncbi:hypothetical protein Pint_31654 [Pistacia integerrima]|uniref:Uncharacterized protein n=1 Tax=Pistacia integerrima TaxID=434235 RepID=A0ACC0XQW3_9ROSI|nr:hypothetical protein Pint_31654 [Pistacia integerrima]